MSFRSWILLGALVALAGCKKSPPPAPAIPSASAAPSAAPAAAPTARVERRRMPVGPRFAIMPGESVGPIRAGATVATIERHMQAKCPELGEKSCRYVDRGIEFELDEKGVLVRMRIHRMGRSAGGGATWGPFHGAIPPDLLFGMLPAAIQEHLGKPSKIVPGAEGAHAEAAEQHHYKQMVLEYDRMPNGQLVLGGVRIPP